MRNSELIINDDGSIYHLHVKNENLADTIILVGDQARVTRISNHFDQIEYKIANREFITHTGVYKGKRLSVLSTGIGTDNIDIVLNELDAAVNMDLNSGISKPERKSLELIRIGTTGALQEDISPGSFVVSEYGLGLDGLMHYYSYDKTEDESALLKKIKKHIEWHKDLSAPYLIAGDPGLIKLLGSEMISGITVTASGFYGPQGRSLHYQSVDHGIDSKFPSFRDGNRRITNFEMETSALYGLSRMMGHKACTCCVVLANRVTRAYTEHPYEVVDRLILKVLESLSGRKA